MSLSPDPFIIQGKRGGADKIKAGDVVQLKSGRPLMTIYTIDNSKNLV